MLAELRPLSSPKALFRQLASPKLWIQSKMGQTELAPSDLPEAAKPRPAKPPNFREAKA